MLYSTVFTNTLIAPHKPGKTREASYTQQDWHTNPYTRNGTRMEVNKRDKAAREKKCPRCQSHHAGHRDDTESKRTEWVPSGEKIEGSKERTKKKEASKKKQCNEHWWEKY